MKIHLKATVLRCSLRIPKSVNHFFLWKIDLPRFPPFQKGEKIFLENPKPAVLDQNSNKSPFSQLCCRKPWRAKTKYILL